MKKLLLCLTMTAFVLACSKSTDDPYADLNKSLSNYKDACSDVVFEDTRSTMAEVNKLQADGKTSEAADLYVVAKQKYDQGVADYSNYKNRLDKANADMRNQASRLSAVERDAKRVAPTEYTNAKAKIEGNHKLAADALKRCAVPQAEGYLSDANKELTYLENLVKSRLGMPVSAADMYTVMKGDSLWKIAANKYSNPYFWPLIYWANSSSIKDPDLIYPNQQFRIDYDSTASMKADAEKLARTRGAWSLYDGK